MKPRIKDPNGKGKGKGKGKGGAGGILRGEPSFMTYEKINSKNNAISIDHYYGLRCWKVGNCLYTESGHRVMKVRREFIDLGFIKFFFTCFK